MKHFLNLLAAIALLLWGTHLVRDGVLTVFGKELRVFLRWGLANRFTAALSGIGITALVQSSTATSLMTASFVGQGLVALPAALAVMRGADIGTALMSVLFSSDLSWLSPLLIFAGVVGSLGRSSSTMGRVGPLLFGLGVMLLALGLVVDSTGPLFGSPAMRAVLLSVDSDMALEIAVGAVLAIVAYSSLAVVLLVAAMASSGAVPLDVALGLVLGANVGSGVSAVLTSAKSTIGARQLTAGNLLFKLLGAGLAAPFTGAWLGWARLHIAEATQVVVLYHLAFNVVAGIMLIGLTGAVARFAQKLLPQPRDASATARLHHLDPSALSAPSQAIANATREVLQQADVVESMLLGLITVIRTDDRRLAMELRKMDDVVDRMYADIKHYLTSIARGAMADDEQRRWTDIIRFAINMEQIADLIEEVLIDVEKKKIDLHRNFSAAGMAEIVELHDRLVSNLRLGMSVFLHGNARDARKLLEEKARFRDLERAYAGTHLGRLSVRSMQSMETSSLHIDLLSNLRRINSHICAIAYTNQPSSGYPARLQ